MSAASKTLSKDVEKYINDELAKQQRMLRAQNNPVRPLTQLQTNTPNLGIGKAQRLNAAAQDQGLINVKLVAIAPHFNTKSVQQPDLEPLPPIEQSFKDQVAKIDKSQTYYMHLFGRVNTMLKTLNQRYESNEPECELISISSTSSDTQSVTDIDMKEYPKRIQADDDSVVYELGPNGTRISADQYDAVCWSTAPEATRGLLSMVFTGDELAKHSLSGKPSPAFYGRERPAKMQLDLSKVNDIITSVRNITGGKERSIRATITTKCADTAKKYKRRAKKALQAETIVID